MSGSGHGLHRDAIVVDGQVVCRWSPEVFAGMHAGGLTAASVTCSLDALWGGLEPNLKALAQWKAWFREYSDWIVQVNTSEDIRRAKEDGRVGIVLGWQNITGFAEYLPYVQLFKELGLRVAQVTYQTGNSAGYGCWDSDDHGLTDFGHDLVAELNRQGILIDLSHVGPRTSRDTIVASSRPVAYTHTAAKALKDHPRNKSDAELRFISDHGGIVGVAALREFLAKDNDSTIDDYLDVVDHLIDVCGEEHVGLGTDIGQGFTHADLWLGMLDKGYGRNIASFKSTGTDPVVRGGSFDPEPPADEEILLARGFQRVDDYPSITEGMERRGWPEPRIRKVLGENWVRTFAEAWGA